MGYDISYHPVSEQQIHTWYFDKLKYPERAKPLAEAHGVEEFYWKQYEETVRAGLSADPDVSFDQTHGHFIATVPCTGRAVLGWPDGDFSEGAPLCQQQAAGAAGSDRSGGTQSARPGWLVLLLQFAQLRSGRCVSVPRSGVGSAGRNRAKGKPGTGYHRQQSVL